jgi:hypothetical protein
MYARAHATIAAFAPGAGKSVPTFILEGLAAGRPFIGTGPQLAEIGRVTGAGLSSDRTVQSLSAAVDGIRDAWPELSARARDAADTLFGVRRFRAEYDALYRELAS